MVLVVVVFVLFLSARGIAQLFTDYLWADQLEVSEVWTGILVNQIVLASVFSAIFGLLVWANLYAADRLAPPFREPTPEEELVARYQSLVGTHQGLVRTVIAVLMGVMVGSRASAQWDTWVRFRNAGDFGWSDPLFGRDAGFYVFRLPMWSYLADFVFGALVVAFLLSVLAHYLNGGIRPSSSVSRITHGVKVHLSGLLAVTALARAVVYWLDRYQLLTARRGQFTGALATDVEVQLPALNLLTLVSLVAAAMFVANVWRRGWGLAVVAVGVWLATQIVVGALFPSLFQRLRVEPEFSSREQAYITDNIDATRFAYGLDPERLETRTFDYSDGLAASEVREYSDVLERLPILDRSLGVDAFRRQQGERAFYTFADPLDVDRYVIDGVESPVVLSVRGLDVSEVPGNTWENEHVAYTHGYGVVVSPANEVGNDGLPRFAVEGFGQVDIEPGFEATMDQPRIYFAENMAGYGFTGATRDEIDFQSADDASESNRYSGSGGAKLGGFMRRLAFALRFGDVDMLFSPFLESETRVMYHRDVMDRVQTAAPFLRFDSDPYPVLGDDQVLWVVDAYTTTDQFPYSQDVDATAAPGSDLAGGLNYVRNSVKAVVGAYDGDVTFFVVDDDDPIVAAYQSAYPDLFTSVSDAPASLVKHFRYPSDLFRVQSDMWGPYHVTDPVQFLQRDLEWSVATQPPQAGSATTSGAVETQATELMSPQHLVTRMPGEKEAEYVLQRVFIPLRREGAGTERPEIESVLMARSDPEHYGELVEYRINGDVEAPDFVDSDIRKDDEIINFITTRTQSKVLFGEMTLIMLNDTVLYIRPLYLEASSTNGVAELSQIVAVNGDRVAMAPTVAEAIAEVIDPSLGSAGSSDDGDEGTDDADSGGGPAELDLEGLSAAELLALADEMLSAADVAEQSEDEGEAARLRDNARAALAQLEELLGLTQPSQPPLESSET